MTERTDAPECQAFEIFRQYWNNCEKCQVQPEYGRIYAIFKNWSAPSERVTSGASKADLLLAAEIVEHVIADFGPWKWDTDTKLLSLASRLRAAAEMQDKSPAQGATSTAPQVSVRTQNPPGEHPGCEPAAAVPDDPVAAWHDWRVANPDAPMYKAFVEDFAKGKHIGRVEGAIRRSFERHSLAVSATDALDALRELIACKDIHDSVENRDMSMSDARATQLHQEYQRRKPVAWERARAVLASTDGSAKEKT